MKVALVGQPNVGKSTVFNNLTGQTQHVGNWAGKTIEHANALCRSGDTLINLVDLPGSYSLGDSGSEERIVRDYLIREKPDVIIVIANAVTLEHNLYLLAEVLALPFKVVLGVNMVDLAADLDIQVEPDVLEAALGLPVVAMTATRTQGLQDLLATAVCLAGEEVPFVPNRPEIRSDHRPVLAQVRSLVEGYVPEPLPVDWAALKLLEGDTEITALVSQRMGSDWNAVQEILVKHDDLMLAIASGRYEWIARMIRAAVVQPRAGQLTLTDRIDRVVTHPGWGMLVLITVLVIFWLTYHWLTAPTMAGNPPGTSQYDAF